MSGLINTTAHRAARNAASIAFADAGPGYASLRAYTAAPGLGGTLLAVRSLDKPCGTVRPADGRIVLATLATNEVAVATGSARWAEWCDASGVAISAGRVTDVDGNVTDELGAVVPDPDGVGEFILGGGASGTMIYAGGLVLLYSGLIG